ncbi:hypothetical protein DQJ01_16895 [Salmonella enterica subsp. enterica]|nr:hypothetical protein [Salmonella enterica subsp. enterica]ECI4564695.1 hypothetical protein [Salmonella enterica subsp. enterica]
MDYLYFTEVGAVFPAPAGINRHYFECLDARFSVPRASGDKPNELRLLEIIRLCSPRQRG